MTAASSTFFVTPKRTSSLSTPQQQGSTGKGSTVQNDPQSIHQPSSISSTISQSEITSIVSACSNDFRFDGRSNLQLRPYTILKSSSSSETAGQQQNEQQLDLTPILSNGSSRLFLPGSNTNVVCSIKAEIVHPPQYQTKHEGLIELNIDLLPFASFSSSTMDRRSIRKEEMEITSTLMHLLIPHLVNKEQLVIIKGKYVWRLHVDVLVMHSDGNLLDVCSMAIWGAMQNIKLPNVVPVVSLFGTCGSDSAKNDNLSAQQTKGSGKKISDEIMLDGDIANAIVPKGVENCPIVVTVNLLPKYEESTRTSKGDDYSCDTPRNIAKQTNCVMVVDANKQEEACATTKVSVCIDPMGNICGVHKYGNSCIILGGSSESSTGGGSVGGTIPFHVLGQVQNAAVSVSEKMFAMLMNDDSTSGRGDSMLDNFSSFFKGHFELQ